MSHTFGTRAKLFWGLAGFAIGWLTIFLQVHLIFNVGSNLYLINGLWIGIGIALYFLSIYLNWWGGSMPKYSTFIRTIAVTMIANGLLYFTQIII